MATQTQQRMTVVDYLAWEERQELKHEYIDGKIIEMTGGTADHSLIKVNILFSLRARANRQEFKIYNGDMRIQISQSRYVYPDLSVARRPAMYEDDKELSLLNPVFVVEVTSPSSETRDRVDKRGFYFDAPSIDAYLIIDQDRVHAHLNTRGGDGWLTREFTSLDDVIQLPMLDCALPLVEVYLDIACAEA